MRTTLGGPGVLIRPARSGSSGMGEGSLGSLAAAAGTGVSRGSSGNLRNVLQGVQGRPGASRGKKSATSGKKKLTPAQQFQNALKKAGVHPVPYQGGPWSIFTNGGGHLVAKVWAEELLRTIGAPVTPGNVAMVYNWEVSEGGGGKYNPLNQGPVPGQPQLTTTGQQYGGGAADFASWQAGIQGAAAYLNMPAFQGIKSALRANDPTLARSALIASPWAASHYGGGSAFANQAPPGGSLAGLPPLTNVPVAGPAGGVSPSPTPNPGQAPGTRAGTKASDTLTSVPGGGSSGGGGGAGGTGGASSAPGGGGPGLSGVFTELPGTGGVETLIGSASGIADLGNAVATFSNTTSTVIKSIDWLFVPGHWVRIFCGIGGVILTAGGIFQLSHTGSTVSVPVAGQVSYPRAVSLPLGIAMVGTGGVLLFVAFHNLPDTVDNFPALVVWLADEIRTGGKTPAFPPDTNPSVQQAPVVGKIGDVIKGFLDIISGGLAGIVP